jgi:hypothetical protein
MSAAGAEPSPCFGDLAPLPEQVAPRIRRHNAATDDMRERHFDRFGKGQSVHSATNQQRCCGTRAR